MTKNTPNNKLAGLFWIISSIGWAVGSFFLQFLAKQIDSQTAFVYLAIAVLNLVIGIYYFFAKK